MFYHYWFLNFDHSIIIETQILPFLSKQFYHLSALPLMKTECSSLGSGDWVCLCVSWPSVGGHSQSAPVEASRSTPLGAAAAYNRTARVWCTRRRQWYLRSHGRRPADRLRRRRRRRQQSCGRIRIAMVVMKDAMARADPVLHWVVSETRTHFPSRQRTAFVVLYLEWMCLRPEYHRSFLRALQFSPVPLGKSRRLALPL